MIKKAVRHGIGVVSVLGYFFNTVFWCIPIFLMSILKLIPLRQWQTLLSHLLDGCASAWITLNNLNQTLTGKTHWQVTGLENLKPDDWYLVISNHQSWVDILVLQRIFNGRIPFLKFFLKKELIWVPFLGLAWWALDFPFMQRYSKSFLAKHPHLKGKDLETTRKACEKFQYKPVSVMNFVEGTRFTEQKHTAQRSPYSHLLSPRAGGIAFVLGAMGSQLHKLLDVTIHYPGGAPSFWSFVCGGVKSIHVNVKAIPMSDILTSEVFSLDYFENPAQKAKFQTWLNQIWAEKNDALKTLSVK